MRSITAAGEERAWALIARRDSRELASSAEATLSGPSGELSIRCYGSEFLVSPGTRTITGADAASERLQCRMGDLFRLSLLWYLASSREIPCTGRFVRIEDIRGGQAFSRGSHVLPLEKVADRYGRDSKGFLEAGAQLGGKRRTFGNASVTLIPFPRVPVILTLWLEDEEFPARADLLLDSSCGLLLPPDIVWSTALMSVKAML